MSYVLPPHLSSTLKVSLQTIYTYLKKYKTEIRTEKKWGKTYISEEDFTRAFKAARNPFESVIEKPIESWNVKDFQDSSPGFKALESKLKIVTEEKERISSRKMVLEEQVKEYAQFFTSEKEERKKLQTSYNDLQSKLNQQIKDFAFEKLTLAKKYYFMVAITIMLIIGLGVTLFFLMYA